jgi:beta-glucosidase
MRNYYKFNKNFIWGVATAAYQIEGAVNTDGRKPSVWDIFSATPGNIANNDTGMIACDHYRRFEDDLKLIADLGVKAYRFSIAWSRVIPEGKGKVNHKGLDFYKRILDLLLKYQIEPFLTCFHWDSPAALDILYNSWLSREIVNDFSDYVNVLVKELGDKVTYWTTINEISNFTRYGYGLGKKGVMAPGTAVSSQKDIQQTIHHALLAHGKAAQVIKTHSAKLQVGLVDNMLIPVPVCETKENIAATAKAALYLNGDLLTPVLTGKYSELLLNELADNAPAIKDGDLATISTPLDYLGINVYSGVYVQKANNKQGFTRLSLPSLYPKMNIDWLYFLPDVLYWGVRLIKDSFNKGSLPLYITENGCAASDIPTAENKIIDTDRILFLREYLRAAHRACKEGYPLKGYFVWSILDNFEWAFGYSKRFGLVYMDYLTQKRIPKESYNWYQKVIKNNCVV